MTSPNPALYAARQAQVAERDALRREHSDILGQLSRLERERYVALETLKQAHGWMSQAIAPGKAVPRESLGLAQRVAGCMRGELLALDRQLEGARGQAERLRGEVAQRQSRVRALERLAAIRVSAQRAAQRRRAERELDRVAAALAPGLRALRAGMEQSPDGSDFVTQPQEYRSWR